METKNKGGKKTLIIIGIILVLVVVGIIVALLTTVARNNKLKATTMRLLRRVNVVTLEDANGKEKAMTDNMKLQNGNALKTEADSMVSVGLDDYKVVTVEEKSRAEFYQSGKQLELNLTDGSLFIDVSQHLADDESFDVRTATMTAGIRGTTIYVNQNPDGTWTMYLVSGALHVHGQNPDTGEEKDVDIVGGQKVTAITFDDRETDTIILRVEEFTEDEMPLQLINELAMNEDALNRAGSESGFDTDYILELANGFGSSGGDNNSSETVETETATETETETESSLEEEGEEGEEGENPEEENLEENAEEEEELTNNDVDDEDVSDDGEDTELTDEESEATEEIDEGFKLSDYVDYIDENGVYHLKDGTTFDPAFYREMYGDVLEQNGYISDEDLLRHYLENGKKENRFPNQESYDAFVEEYNAELLRQAIEEQKAKDEAKENEQQQQEDVSDSGTTEENDVFSYEIILYAWATTSLTERPNYSIDGNKYEWNVVNNNSGSGSVTRTTVKDADGNVVSVTYSPASLSASATIQYNFTDLVNYQNQGTVSFNFTAQQIQDALDNKTPDEVVNAPVIIDTYTVDGNYTYLENDTENINYKAVLTFGG